MSCHCIRHGQYSLDVDVICTECHKEKLLKDAAGELYNACEQARDTIRQVSIVEMSGSVDLIKKRLAKAEQICYEAMRLALTGE